MRAVIVSDVEMNSLLDRLEMKKDSGPSNYEAQNLGMTKEMYDAMHRQFLYQVVRWIQAVGGEVKR